MCPPSAQPEQIKQLALGSFQTEVFRKGIQAVEDCYDRGLADQIQGLPWLLPMDKFWAWVETIVEQYAA